MSSLIASISQGCTVLGGVLTLTQADASTVPGADLSYRWVILDSAGTDHGNYFDPATLPIEAAGLADGSYQVLVRATDDTNGGVYVSPQFLFTLSCGATSSGLMLDSVAHTNETVATHDGTATIQASGGLAPLTATIVETGATQAATSGAPTTFTGLAPGTITLRVTDSSTPTPAFVEGVVTVLAYAAPVTGCQDEYATDYDPAATVGASCAYSPRWRSAWQPVAVRVAAAAGQTMGYLTAGLRIGFQAGHPLAGDRPLGDVLPLRATVGPDGFATFRLDPYLQPQLGTPDGSGGYRLDLNSAAAFGADLFVGYELRRPDGELLEHGYALNAAVPDAQLNQALLSPFMGGLPVWPGFDDYLVAYQTDTSAGRYALVENDAAFQYDTVRLPCPTNPLPVRWLAPGSGYGFWVFQGRPQLGDEVGDGQAFSEASTGERRWSQRGEARDTITASSGVFKGRDLMAGLRTLWRSPQVWYQPEAGGPWVAVTLEPGTFPAGRLGVNRQQVSISFTEAKAQWAQGQ